ncbi:hypothetical protein [Pseudocitrobacter corydidari]|uniref:Lipoprotein n=1 Tax=Pseudocitrobacter corydidari TaxID=2891570 RepID=A0ABY3S169_9ENTR|nr:hypothetical protein [Pseudocitrobacter corydidari]UGS39803.1 hypothetical protein G163CM_04880 [Pseudocitrobacter corydidari]
MLRKCLYLTSLMMLIPGLAQACSGVSYSAFLYQKSGNGAKYVVGESRDDYNIHFPDILLPQVTFSQLRRVPDAIIHRYDSPKEINHDFIMASVYSGELKNGGWRFDWLTDGQHILWAGKIVQNPPGAPKVDVATFRAYGRFAADKDSLYFDGERTDDNHGEKQVDFASLQSVGGIPDAQDDADVLKDSHNLYYRGRWISSAKGYVILGVKSWNQNGPIRPRTTCDTRYNPGPWDTLFRTPTQVFLNGKALPTDPDSFAIVRWMPGTLLIYRDKNGTHRYAFGKNCLDTFDIQKDKVTWITRDASTSGDDCRIETLEGVDPEHFTRLNGNSAQYKDSLYQFKYRSPLDKTLVVTKIIDPELQLERGLNQYGRRVYFVGLDEVQTFDTVGALVWLKNPDGTPSDTFARDERYLYFISDSMGRMARMETRDLDAAYLSKGNHDLVTVEGNYDWLNNHFTPVSELDGEDSSSE